MFTVIKTQAEQRDINISVTSFRIDFEVACIIISISHFSFFDEIQRNFNKRLFDKLSFNVISTSGRVRLDVVFNEKVVFDERVFDEMSWKLLNLPFVKTF